MISSLSGGALAAAAFIALSSPALALVPFERAQAAPNSTQPAPVMRIAAANTTASVVKSGTLTIEQPWSRATPGGAKVGGGYVRITNTGQTEDRLIGGSFSLAGRVEVHEMRMEGDVMRMKPVEGGLAIKPGGTVELRPGGYHLMFMDLKEPLKEGQTVKGTLVFEKAGAVELEYSVRSMGGQGMAPAEHKHH
jgi:copper(I)-binding protein